MTLRLTPSIMALTFDLLAETEPFCRWNLPPAEDIKFIVDADRKTRGWFTVCQRELRIGVSRRCIGQLATLEPVLGHEIIHLHEYRTKIRWYAGDVHSREFKKWAALACKIHGWDLQAFY